MKKPPCLCTGRTDIQCDETHCSLAGLERNQCGICHKFLTDPAYNQLWGGKGIPQKKPACIHLGSATGETIFCPHCPNGTQGTNIPLYHCAIHQKTAGRRFIKNHTTCLGCPDYQEGSPFTGEIVRHLLYFIAPFSGNGIWQRNVGQLLKRIKLFNGHRIIGVVTGQGMDPVDHVKDQLAGQAHEFITAPNNPDLREVQLFEPMFERIEGASPNSVCLYAHAKGVARSRNSPVQRWTEMLYETYLDYWPLVEKHLKASPLAGVFKRHLQAWPPNQDQRYPQGSKSQWHYSGSWCWFRCKDFFKKTNWREVDRFWSGIEGHFSLKFPAEEGSCLFHEWHGPGIGLYDLDFLNEVEIKYARWKRDHHEYLRSF